MPSARVLSLALTTLFPALLHGPERQPDASIYQLERHPLPALRHAERRLISECARAATTSTTVSATTLPAPGVRSPALAASHAGGLVEYGWSVVRVDVRNLTATVQHHFDYATDGHTRTYELRAESNSTGWSVHLVRAKDGFHIPYATLEGVSLIALLRMGLLPAFRDRFYDLFLRLPLYEDMAPWNIVFRGGGLHYIDFDTKDVTFSAVAKTAYQVMALLMNYERTVKDFGRCGQRGENEYNVPWISSCVGSDFRGPCKSSSHPVPCGDGTCKPHYVDCLLALRDMERRRADRSDLDAGDRPSLAALVATPDADAWVRRHPCAPGRARRRLTPGRASAVLRPRRRPAGAVAHGAAAAGRTASRAADLVWRSLFRVRQCALACAIACGAFALRLSVTPLGATSGPDVGVALFPVQRAGVMLPLLMARQPMVVRDSDL